MSCRNEIHFQFLHFPFSEWRVSPDHLGAPAVAWQHNRHHPGGWACRPHRVPLCAWGQTLKVPGTAEGSSQMWAQSGVPAGGSWPAWATGRPFRMFQNPMKKSSEHDRLKKNDSSFSRLTLPLASRWRRSCRCCPGPCGSWSVCAVCTWPASPGRWTSRRPRRRCSMVWCQRTASTASCQWSATPASRPSLRRWAWT